MTDAEVDTIVTANMRLAYWMANKCALYGLDHDQALSVAMGALLAASTTYDPKHVSKSSFGNYAAISIRHALQLERARTQAVKRGGRVDHVSLDDPTGGPGGPALGDSLAEEMPAIGQAELEWLQAAVATLTDRQRYVVRRHYGLDGDKPETLGAIAPRLGRTKQRLQQVEAKALARLRRELRRLQRPDPTAA
jgi:RNA polymerase sigma factor (sigma-70 family)